MKVSSIDSQRVSLLGNMPLLRKYVPGVGVGVSEAQTRPLHSNKTLLTKTEVGTRDWSIAMIDLLMSLGLGI